MRFYCHGFVSGLYRYKFCAYFILYILYLWGKELPAIKCLRAKWEKKYLHVIFSSSRWIYGMLQKCPSIYIFNYNVRLHLSVCTRAKYQNQEYMCKGMPKERENDDDKMYSCKKCEDKMCPPPNSTCNMISKFWKIWSYHTHDR